MIQSMTGFGIAVNSSENYKVTVEVKSLNGKFFELGLKVPRAYMKYETPLRNQLTRELERGKINLMINVEFLNPAQKSLNINYVVLENYVNTLAELQNRLNLPPVSFDTLLTLPEVMIEDPVKEDSEEWDLIEKTTLQACKELINSRKEEGKSIEKDFEDRLSAIEASLQEVTKLAPNRIENIRSRLTQQLEEIKSRIETDKNRFEQELIFYLEKLDINEEIVRLTQHISYYRSTVQENISNGKQLNFIAQEMGREINTIGSKANDAAIQRWVVRMKDELEKIKEQTLNIV